MPTDICDYIKRKEARDRAFAEVINSGHIISVRCPYCFSRVGSDGEPCDCKECNNRRVIELDVFEFIEMLQSVVRLMMDNYAEGVRSKILLNVIQGKTPGEGLFDEPNWIGWANRGLWSYLPDHMAKMTKDVSSNGNDDD